MLKTPIDIDLQELEDAYAAIVALGYAADHFTFYGWCGRTQSSKLGRPYVEAQRGDETSMLYEAVGMFSWVTKFEDDLIAGVFGPK